MESSSSSSSSMSICELDKSSREFIIKGYSHLKSRMAPQDSISSDKFQVGGYDWRMKFYPAGTDDDPSYVSVFIKLENDLDGVEAFVKFTLIDHSEKEKHKVRSFVSSFGARSWGYPTFIKRTALENSHFLENDCLVIICTVGVVRHHTQQPKTVPIPPLHMVQSLKELMESDIGTDIAFEVGEETFKAHKLILAAHSPVFRAQFFGLVANKDMDKVLIKEVEPSVFKAMLMFMYSDELSLSTPSQMVHDLLSAADRFGLDRLKLLCESRLCEEITTSTVTTTLFFAESHHCSNLKTFCLQFVAKPENLGEVMKSEGFEHLKASCPSLAMELLEFVCRHKC